MRLLVVEWTETTVAKLVEETSVVTKWEDTFASVLDTSDVGEFSIEAVVAPGVFGISDVTKF